jgi:hypothetical protein
MHDLVDTPSFATPMFRRITVFLYIMQRGIRTVSRCHGDGGVEHDR